MEDKTNDYKKYLEQLTNKLNNEIKKVVKDSPDMFPKTSKEIANNEQIKGKNKKENTQDESYSMKL